MCNLISLCAKCCRNGLRLSFPTLIARHGCKCPQDELITVEDCLNDANNILFASRMNKAFVTREKYLSDVFYICEFWFKNQVENQIENPSDPATIVQANSERERM